ncbi:MAG: hypothetical protein LBQ50_00890, partial [Planctomycetaceae bacterium]|nr:hypothetical protein [Planctomycetaceae bacterium]
MQHGVSHHELTGTPKEFNFDVCGYGDKVNPVLLNSYGVLVLFVHLPRAAQACTGLSKLNSYGVVLI